MTLSEFIAQLQNEYNKHGDITVIKASDAEGNDFDTVYSIDVATYSEEEYFDLISGIVNCQDNDNKKCLVIW